MQLDALHLVSAIWIGVLLFWLLASFGTKRRARTQPPFLRLLQLVFMVGTFMLLSNRGGNWGVLGRRFVSDSRAIQAIGVALTAAGVAFAIWARVFLGRNWSATVSIKRDHELVSTGPYAIVRHPIYSGFLLALFGTALVIGELRALLAVALAFVGWRLKSRTEEAFMLELFGPQYADYKRRVKALIPFVL